MTQAPQGSPGNAFPGSLSISALKQKSPTESIPWASLMQLRYRHWTPRNEPWVHVIALHGLQSHSGWYTQSSARLANVGCDVIALDRRGSGLNGGTRGHADRADQLIGDVVQVLAAVRAASDLPVVLTGVSWGARLATAVMLERPDLVEAVALLSPGLFPKAQPTWGEVLALRCAGAIGWGLARVTIPNNDAALLTADPNWQEFTRRDELALHNVTVDFLLANRELMRRINSARQLPKPALMMLAGLDAVIDNARSRAWFERTASEPRRLIEYPDAHHTLQFEPNWQCVADDLVRWMADVVRR